MRTAVATVLLLLLLSCGGPPHTLAVGEPLHLDEAGFSLTVANGWTARPNRTGVTLTRSTPYGDGFPSLVVRRIAEAEVEALQFDGSRFKSPAGPTVWRYQSWSNTRGRGWRLEALIGDGPSRLFAEGSVWDEAPTIDRQIFEEEFWPMVNSLSPGAR